MERGLSLREVLLGLGTVTVAIACGTASAQTVECTVTPSNPLGPFHRADAPFRSSLNVADAPGRPLRVTGWVLRAPDCSPVPGAVLDVWQADGEGRYDNDSSAYGLRGRVQADESGHYVFDTVMPGAYPGRPRHIHVRVLVHGQRALTTQIYFPEDPIQHLDPFHQPALVAQLNEQDGLLVATWNVVLARD